MTDDSPTASPRPPAPDARQFELLVKAITDYAIYMLNPSGIITSWNAGAERAKGYTEAEIIGQHFSRFFTPEDQAAGKPNLALETARETGRFEDEGWRVRKDGTRFWAHVLVDPIRDESGNLLGFAKVIRDATERRDLEIAKEQLHQAQKMEAVGQLTGGVAHDFNNLLTAVLGSLSLVAQMTSDSRILRLVETAQRAAARGAKLTSQLLAFARRQTLTPQVSNVNELIGVFEMLLRRAVGETIACEINLDPALWLVEIDQAQFQSAILNLVVNARDAMNGIGGTLTVATRNDIVSAARASALGDLSAGDYVVVSVRDTGTGMTPEVKAHAIEPFYTTKEIGQGTGLGLSQVYGFVRQSKGQLEIESEVGRGTTVRFYVPRFRGGAVSEKLAAADKQEVRLRSVLVVEDDADVLEVAMETLRSLGYKVYTAANAPEALTILQRDVPIDVLFTDVVMPKGMSGIELAREARLLRPKLRVLLSSGYAREALQDRERIPEDLEFIEKPYPLPALAERLRAMMREG